MGKESARSAGASGDTGSIPELGRFSGGGNGHPLQYSYLENPIGSRAWQAATKGHKDLGMTEHACTVNAISGIPERVPNFCEFSCQSCH